MTEPVAEAIQRLLARPDSERRIGPFLLIDKLGEGGYAPVWLARETYGRAELRTAAVKLFALDAETEERDRIIEEARALCRVEHPNVVRFYTLAIDEEAGVMGLAMEHVAGRSLEDKLHAEETLSVEETLRVGVAIASALAAVHSAGLVHRDVKPNNIVEELGGAYKLIDFGIASRDLDGGDELPIAGEDGEEGAHLATPTMDRDRSRNTTSAALAATARVAGVITGTLGYIDPACYGGSALPSAASDLYALGATLYRCLTGCLPAEKTQKNDMDARVALGHAPPISIAARKSGLPAALVSLLDRMLAPRPADRPPRASWVAHHLEQMLLELGGKDRELPSEEVGPFRGLRRFEADDKDVFFGRTPEIAAAIELLRGRGLVALVGPSGSGKSSLARAGLLPAIAKGELSRFVDAWDTAIAEPGRDPRGAIDAALLPFVPDAPSLDAEGLALALARRVDEEGRGLVLFVDQLEELVTTAAPESTEAACAFLVAAGGRAIEGLRIVVAARQDLLSPLLAMGDLGKAMARALCLVEPLKSPVWRGIVERSLASYGYDFEDTLLAEELFAEIDSTQGAMPLVEFALTEMWKERDRKNRRITRASLEKVGGIEGALEQHAEATIDAITSESAERLEAMRLVLLSLTTAEGTRRTMSVEEIRDVAGASARSVIDALLEARLVVPAEGGVTLAHEALATRWTRLARWISEARDERALVEELERDATRWKKDPESMALWKGPRLHFASDIQKRGLIRLSENAEALVRMSRHASRRGKLLAALVALFVVVSSLVAGINYVRVLRAEENAAKQRMESEAKLREDAEQSARTQEELLAQIRDSEQTTEDLKRRIDEVLDVKAKRDERLGATPATTPSSPLAAPSSKPTRSTAAMLQTTATHTSTPISPTFTSQTPPIASSERKSSVPPDTTF